MAEKKTPSKQPDVTAPASPVKTPTGHTPARFTYVPGDGLYAGDAKTWAKVSDTPEWKALRANNRLSIFLTKNPLAVVYAHLMPDSTVLLTALHMGGQFVEDQEAMAMTPGLEWWHTP